MILNKILKVSEINTKNPINVLDINLTIDGDTTTPPESNYSINALKINIVNTTGINVNTISMEDAVSFSSVSVDDLVVSGDLTVNGTTTTIDTETMLVEDNIIVVNYGQTGTPTLDGGIEVERGDLTNYQFLYDETDDMFRIGEIGSLQAVATREDSPVNTGLAFWNATANRFDTSTDLTFDGTGVNISGTLETSGLSSLDGGLSITNAASGDNYITLTDTTGSAYILIDAVNNSSIHFHENGADRFDLTYDIGSNMIYFYDRQYNKYPFKINDNSLANALVIDSSGVDMAGTLNVEGTTVFNDHVNFGSGSTVYPNTHINYDTDADMYLSYNNAVGTGTFTLRRWDGTNYYTIVSATSSAISNALTIDSSGVNMAGTLGVNNYIQINRSSSDMLVLNSTSDTGDIALVYKQNGTLRAYVKYLDSDDIFQLVNIYGDIKFKPGNGATTDKMIVGYDGVGIGLTSTDNSLLQIASPDTIAGSDLSKSALLIGDLTTGLGIDNNEITNKGNSLYFQAIDNDIYIITKADKYIHLSTYGVERFRIDGSGNAIFYTSSVEITSGTSGDAVLTIRADTDNNNENDNPRIEMYQDGNVFWSKYGINGDADNSFTGAVGNYGYMNTTTGYHIAISGTAALTVNSSRYVGINDTTPSYLLDVNGTLRATGAAYLNSTLTVSGAAILSSSLTVGASGTDIYIFHSTSITASSLTKTYGGILQRNTGENLAFRMYGDDTTDRISFMTDYGSSGTWTERMCILANNGYIGINDTTPSYPLDVNGIIRGESFNLSAYNSGGLKWDSTNNYVKINSAYGIQLYIEEAGYGTGTINFYSGAGSAFTMNAYGISTFEKELRVDTVFSIKDGITAPSTLTGYARIYVDSADGDLKIKFSDGTVKTIVVDT